MSQQFEWLKSFRTEVLVPASLDFIRSVPDALLVGTGFMALLTQSFPLIIFLLALLETSLLQQVLGGLAASISPPTRTQGNVLCQAGLPSPYVISVANQILKDVPFPSAPIWFVSSAIGQSGAAILNFRNELAELGKTNSAWKVRMPLGLTFCSLLWVAFIIWRIVYGCDSVVPALGTAVIGLGIGGVLMLFHAQLFGRDSINLLGLPLLADRAAEARPLQVCAKP